MENYQTDADTIEIDLREIFSVLLHRLWIIVLSAVVLGIGAFAISKFAITPTYISETRIIVLNKANNDNLTYSDMQLGTQLTKDYPEVIRSRRVIEQVIQDFGLDMTYKKFLSMMEVKTSSDTRIINITIEHENPMLAKQLVDAVRDEAAVRIKEVMNIEAVNVVDEGNLPVSPSNPNVSKWTLLGFLLGGFAAAAVVIIQFLLDDTIKCSEDIEKYLHLSTLALIPIVEDEAEQKNGKHHRRVPTVDLSEEKQDSKSHKIDDMEITEL